MLIEARAYGRCISSTSAFDLADSMTSNVLAIRANAGPLSSRPTQTQSAVHDRSSAPGLNVTEYVTVATQEYDAVTGCIRSVPFELVVRDFYFRSDLDVRPAARFVGPVVGDLHIGLAVPDMDFICPVGVGFAAT